VRRAFLPHTTTSPTANWRSPTWRWSGPSWPAELLAGGVELVDLLAPVGQDRHPLALLERLPPVSQEGLLELAGGLGGDQPPVGAVSSQRRVEVAGAEVLDRLPLPGLLLATVLGQLACPQADA
jgi:hypothetical protein